MNPIKRPKPLSVTKRLLNSFNSYNLFGMVTEMVQRYKLFWNSQTLIYKYSKIYIIMSILRDSLTDFKFKKI